MGWIMMGWAGIYPLSINSSSRIEQAGGRQVRYFNKLMLDKAYNS